MASIAALEKCSAVIRGAAENCANQLGQFSDSDIDTAAKNLQNNASVKIERNAKKSVVEAINDNSVDINKLSDELKAVEKRTTQTLRELIFGNKGQAVIFAIEKQLGVYGPQ